PLTNHVGLRTLLTHGVGTGSESGRMRYARDDRLTDPFGAWKRLRLERWERARPVGVALAGAGLLGLGWVVWRRARALWAAQCLSQLAVVLVAQLTNYYYSFLLLSAPLARARRRLAAPLLGVAVASHFVAAGFWWTDDRYAALGLLALLWCGWVVWTYAKRPRGRLSPGAADGR
ncbi:MAG TPA: hypothetical protein VFX98_04125, partial [Longimicrobiaceae bacterium]|nr:hypothetical protein [Longimicrobiaceae bacterium]